MGLLRIVGLGFLALVLLGLALFVTSYVNQASQPKPYLAMNIPAGLYYKGPETTAIAGWYCIESINASDGYSIQLNAWLDNQLTVQDAYGTFVSESVNGGPWIVYTAFLDNVWTHNGPTSILLHASNPTITNAQCAWLVIALKDNYAYFGYSLDGESIIWFDKYPVNASYIISKVPGLSLYTDYTGIVLAGPGNGEQAQLGRGTLVYLALYYWNGTGWVLAPAGVNQGLQTGETVNHAWVLTDGTCGVVSWSAPANVTQCPSPPSFRP